MIKTSSKIASKFLSKVCVANFSIYCCFSFHYETTKKSIPKTDVLLIDFLRELL